jgi:hypothetical protein
MKHALKMIWFVKCINVNYFSLPSNRQNPNPPLPLLLSRPFSTNCHKTNAMHSSFQWKS